MSDCTKALRQSHHGLGKGMEAFAIHARLGFQLQATPKDLIDPQVVRCCMVKVPISDEYSMNRRTGVPASKWTSFAGRPHRTTPNWRIPVSKCFMIHNIHNIKLSQEHILYISGHFTVLLPGSKRICIQPSRIFPMTWSSTGVARVALCGTPTRQIEGRGPR